MYAEKLIESLKVKSNCFKTFLWIGTHLIFLFKGFNNNNFKTVHWNKSVGLSDFLDPTQ